MIGDLVVLVFCFRLFINSRASANSIYLISMASSFSAISCVSIYIVFYSSVVSLVVFGLAIFVLTITSFPFLVGTVLAAGWITTRPLEVGRSVSSVMGWSSPVTIGGSAKSIRFVIGIGSICCLCIKVSFYFPSSIVIYP